MSIVKSYPLASDYKLDLGAPWEVPLSIVPRVEEIWDLERERRGTHLTNGQIYTLAEYRPAYLLIQPSEYRYVLARRRAPNLKNEGLSVQALAVTGILLCTDGLVLGRRGSVVTDDAGLWEPAPAGGLSKPDPTAQILEELEEELGISKAEVEAVEVCGLVEDVDSSVFDIVFRLNTGLTAQEVRAVHACRGSDEYAELAIVETSEVSAFLNTHSSDLLPALRTMLRLAEIV